MKCKLIFGSQLILLSRYLQCDHFSLETITSRVPIYARLLQCTIAVVSLSLKKEQKNKSGEGLTSCIVVRRSHVMTWWWGCFAARSLREISSLDKNPSQISSWKLARSDLKFDHCFEQLSFSLSFVSFSFSYFILSLLFIRFCFFLLSFASFMK